MAKKQKNKQYVSLNNQGEICNHCDVLMERRKRIVIPKNKTYFFTEWDYCTKCNRVQHYEKFKSHTWQEDELQKDFFRSLRD